MTTFGKCYFSSIFFKIVIVNNPKYFMNSLILFPSFTKNISQLSLYIILWTLHINDLTTRTMLLTSTNLSQGEFPINYLQPFNVLLNVMFLVVRHTFEQSYTENRPLNYQLSPSFQICVLL